MKTEDLNFKSVSVMMSTSITTLSTTWTREPREQLGNLLHSNNRGCTDKLRKIRNAPSAIPGTTRTMIPLFTMLFHPSPNGRMEMDSLSRVRIAQVVECWTCNLAARVKFSRAAVSLTLSFSSP